MSPLFSARHLRAERIFPDDHEASSARADTHTDFDRPFQGDDVPRHIDTLLDVACATSGERFAGQDVTRVSVGAFPGERLSGEASAPLTVVAGNARSTLAVYRNPGFEKMSLGGPTAGARGKGALAIRFNAPQANFSVTNHAEPPDGRPFTGRLQRRLRMKICDQNARLLASPSLPWNDTRARAFRTRSGAPAIAWISLHNTDPGGRSIINVHIDCQGGPVS